MLINQSYKDSEMWHEAVSLSLEVFGATCSCYNVEFKEEICHASISIPFNISEGLGGISAEDEARFFQEANKACAEVCRLSTLGLKKGYYSASEMDDLFDRADSISEMLAKAIKPNSA